jgi:Flp pilus assembly protein protease CpaA
MNLINSIVCCIFAFCLLIIVCIEFYFQKTITNNMIFLSMLFIFIFLAPHSGKINCLGIEFIRHKTQKKK